MRIGVVVGRFQIDTLHTGHQDLLVRAAKKSDALCVVLGLNENRGSRRNPLDFMSRKASVEDWHRQSPIHLMPLVVLPQQDQNNDTVWSQNLDRMLRQAFPGATITLYGGRDSFLAHYQGTLKTEDLSQEVDVQHQISATERRLELARAPGTSAEFRRGVIYGAYNQWPRLFMCVDVAVLRHDTIVVGKRNHESHYRFFGGFVDQADPSLEAAAHRELLEEARVDAPIEHGMTYLGSYKVPDYRYRSPDDGLLMTAFYAVQTEDMPEAGDDIDEVVHLHLSLGRELLVKGMVDAHQPLMHVVLNHLVSKGKYNG